MNAAAVLYESRRRAALGASPNIHAQHTRLVPGNIDVWWLQGFRTSTPLRPCVTERPWTGYGAASSYPDMPHIRSPSSSSFLSSSFLSSSSSCDSESCLMCDTEQVLMMHSDVFPWEHQSIYALLHRHRFTRPHHTRPQHPATRRNHTQRRNHAERRGEAWEEEESDRDADGGVGSEASKASEGGVGSEASEACALTGRRWTRCYAHAHTCYQDGDAYKDVDNTGAAIPGGGGRGVGGDDEEDTDTDTDTGRVCLWHLVRSPPLPAPILIPPASQAPIHSRTPIH